MRGRIALLQTARAPADSVTSLLRGNGYDVIHLSTGAALMEAMRRDTFDALLVDWEAIDMPGDAVLRGVRGELRDDVPVLVLAASDSELAASRAFGAGAKDCLVKPWRPEDLLARVQLLLRSGRESHRDRNEETIEAWRFNALYRTASNGQVKVKLSRKEFETARLLLRNLGRPLSRQHIRDSVWGEAEASRSLDTHVSRLRTRMRLTIEHGYLLSAIYGYGYRLDRVA